MNLIPEIIKSTLNRVHFAIASSCLTQTSRLLQRPRCVTCKQKRPLRKRLHCIGDILFIKFVAIKAGRKKSSHFFKAAGPITCQCLPRRPPMLRPATPHNADPEPQTPCRLPSNADGGRSRGRRVGARRVRSTEALVTVSIGGGRTSRSTPDRSQTQNQKRT